MEEARRAEEAPERAPRARDLLGPLTVLRGAEAAVARHGRAALAHIVRAEGSTPGKPGWKLLVTPDGETIGNLGGGAFEAMVAADARSRLAEPRPENGIERYYLTEEAVKGQATGMVCGGMVEVFLEVITAPPLLAIFGGGPVGQALAQAGDLAGFDLLVVDDRAELRRPELFPAGAALPAAGGDFRGDYLEALGTRPLYATVVTRCWDTDVAALAAVLGQAPPQLAYLGLMGSRRKVEHVRQELTGAGFDLDAVPFHAPIGLPIGGDSPGEIAIAVLAEIQKVRYAAEVAT